MTLKEKIEELRRLEKEIDNLFSEVLVAFGQFETLANGQIYIIGDGICSANSRLQREKAISR